jgi:hypothetical protein
LTLDVRDKPHAAGVVLISRVVQTMLGGEVNERFAAFHGTTLSGNYCQLFPVGSVPTIYLTQRRKGAKDNA